MDHKFAIFALQRSGTNYLDRLMLENFECRSMNNDRSGNKHFWKHSLEVNRTADFRTIDCIFIMHKNPYKWVESISSRNHADYIKRQRKYPADDRSAGSVLCGKHNLNVINLVKTWNEFYRNYLEFEWPKEPIWLPYRDLLIDETREAFLDSLNFKKTVTHWRDIEAGSVSQSRGYTKASREYYLDDSRLDHLDSRHIESINTVLDREILSKLGYTIHG